MPPDLTRTRRAILQTALRLGPQALLGTVAHDIKLSKQAVSQQVSVLRDLGYLERAESRYSPLIPTEKAQRSLGVGLAIYGRIAAGPPSLAEQDPDGYTPTLEALLGLKPGDFLLKVQGESMINVGVLDGDYVVVRPACEVHDGDVAVVLLPGEDAATLKRLYRFGSEVILMAENPAMPRMVFEADQVQVQGKMVGRVGVGVPRLSAKWG